MVVRAVRRFERDLRRLPEHIRDKVILWIEFVESLGLREVRLRPGFHDEPLCGLRRGQRSIRLSRSYRLLYIELKVEKEILLLEVSKHEY